MGTGVFAHTRVSESTKQRVRLTHKNPLLLHLPFLSPDYKKTRGHLYPASVAPPDTATNGLFHDISLLTSSSPHPEPLTQFVREQSALLKDLSDTESVFVFSVDLTNKTFSSAVDILINSV